MALGATIRKLELSVADMDRDYYASHSLTLAQHPSEKDERLMLRVLAFAMFADERLEFGRGLSTDDEPDLWLVERNDRISCWVDLGLPDDKRVRKACGRADQVVLLLYGASKTDAWLRRQGDTLSRFENLSLRRFDDESMRSLGAMADRNMALNVSIQDGQLMVSSDAVSLTIDPKPVNIRKN